jgi:hypothetical protein
MRKLVIYAVLAVIVLLLILQFWALRALGQPAKWIGQDG